MFGELAWPFALVLVLQLLPAPPSPAANPEAARLQRAMRTYDWEPTARETQVAAVAHAGLGADRVAGMRPRVRWRALVPDALEARYQVDDGLSERFNTSEDLDTDLRVLETATTSSRTDDLGARWYLGARWDLRGLVFDPKELDIEKVAVQIADDRIDLETLVAKVWFARRRLQVDLLLDPPTSAEEAAPLYLDLREHTAHLDALTGGWFTKELQRRRRGAPAKR